MVTIIEPELNKLCDVSLQEYLRAPGLSRSDLMRMDCPLRYVRGLEGDEEETASQANGTLVHTLALEPHRYAERYYPEPALPEGSKNPRGTKAYKEAVAELEAQFPQKVMVRADKEYHAAQLATAIRKSGVFEHLLEGEPLVEQSIWFNLDVYDEDTDEMVPVLCKARPDAHREREHDVVCADLKIAHDASPRGFGRASAQFGYDIGAYMQAQALRAVYGKPVVWIAFVIEPNAPYLTAYYRFGTGPQAIGQARAQKALRTWLRCDKTKSWPGYNGGKIADVQLPGWLEKEVMDDQLAENPEPF